MSYLTRIINNAAELMGDCSNKGQLQILLPKVKEVINKIYVINKDYCSFFPKKTSMKILRFFHTQKFRSIQVQTSIQRFLDQCKPNTRYSILSVYSKQSSELS